MRVDHESRVLHGATMKIILDEGLLKVANVLVAGFRPFRTLREYRS